MLVVKVHNGNAHVKGRARCYKYYVASLFIPVQTKGGYWIYKNSGIHTYPRRSLRLAIQDGEKLAKKYPICKFVDGYGSLHNKKA